MIRLTKIFSFETAHALFGYNGKCKNIHGHSYKLYVTVIGEPENDPNSSTNGMIMDFGELKSIVNHQIINIYDHAILLNIHTEHKTLGEKLLTEGHKVIFTDFQPTCENMVLHFAKVLQKYLPNKVDLIELKLYETEKSYCEWKKSDQYN